FPSRLPSPGCLAVPACLVVVRAAPTRPCASRVRLPSASPACCDRSEAGLPPRSVSWRLVAHALDLEAAVADLGQAQEAAPVAAVLLGLHLGGRELVEQAQAVAQQVARVALAGLVQQVRLGHRRLRAASHAVLDRAQDDADVLGGELAALEGGGGA